MAKRSGAARSAAGAKKTRARKPPAADGAAAAVPPAADVATPAPPPASEVLSKSKAGSSEPQPDVLVLGDHPCAHVAALILAEAGVRVAIMKLPDEREPERLVMLNPGVFELTPALGAVRRQLDLVPTFGLHFIADDPKTHSEHRSNTISSYVGSYCQFRDALSRASRDAGVVHMDPPKSAEATDVAEAYVEISIDGRALRPKLLIIAGPLSDPSQRVLGYPEPWEPEMMRRLTHLRVTNDSAATNGGAAKPTLPMSLDLDGQLHWAWMLPAGSDVQLVVEHSVLEETDGRELMRRWIEVLTAHGVLKPVKVELDKSFSLDLPLAGALSRDCVATHALLIGPAAGFYSACGEDLYPNCWSATFAADTAKKALKERHLQDALQTYRQRWGSTLGDYLRGPQQNLRFLLPLVYRNSTMTTRLAEAILHGQSVVR